MTPNFIVVGEESEFSLAREEKLPDGVVGSGVIDEGGVWEAVRWLILPGLEKFAGWYTPPFIS